MQQNLVCMLLLFLCLILPHEGDWGPYILFWIDATDYPRRLLTLGVAVKA
jgi:hypothetical protein